MNYNRRLNNLIAMMVVLLILVVMVSFSTSKVRKYSKDTTTAIIEQVSGERN